MGWAIGDHDGRDIGYGVPATCDFPRCGEKIDRGLSYVCGSEPFGGDHGCGRFFCQKHRPHWRGGGMICTRCQHYREPFKPTPDVDEWVRWKLTDESWAEWRAENPQWVAEQAARLGLEPAP